MTKTALEGGCACGAARYRLKDKPLFVHCCHCTECQRQTGSAFAVNAMIETERLELMTGKIVEQQLTAASGNPVIETRCSNCATALWLFYAGAGRRIAFVRVGSLDAPARCPPDIHIFTGSRQPWVILPADTPAMEEFYRREAYWPVTSLARREAALAAPESVDRTEG